MSTTNYKMIGKLESGNWTSWLVQNTPDYTGALYTGGGSLISNTIEVSANYLNIDDYYYKMIGKLESGIWVSWKSLYSPDYSGIYYKGEGILIQNTIQVTKFIQLPIYQFPTMPDATVNGYHGIMTNMEVSDIQNYTPGSQALVFDGVNEYVKMGDVLDFEYTNSFTLSCWFKTLDAADYFICKQQIGTNLYRGYGIGLTSPGAIYVSLRSNNATSNKITVKTIENGFNDNAWHHLVFTWNGSASPVASGVLIYVDNILQSNSVVDDNLSGTLINSSEFTLACRSGIDSFIACNLEDVAVWNKKLTVTEVAEIYNNAVPHDLTLTSCAVNLAAWWRCGEKFSLAAGGVPDFSGNGLHGTQVDMEITDVNSRIALGKSVIFGGSNEYITMGDVLGFNSTDAFSYSFWIKTTTVSDYILAKMDATANYRGYGIYITDSGKINVLLDNTTTLRINMTTTTMTINNGAWHHVVVTYSGSGLASGVKCYVDSILVSMSITTDTLENNTIITSAEFNIGSRTNGSLVLEGSLDEVSAWDKELSSGEIISIYNKGIPTDLKNSANLVGYWKMGDGISI